MNRIAIHLVADLNDRELSGLTRDELQDLLDLKAGREALSYSTVAHLRWDLKQVFDMAVAEGHIARNPALLLFTPKDAKRTERAIMTGAEVQTCFRVLGPRERLIAKLAILAGMRPGEIFALTWGEMTSTYANIRQRVYRGVIDSPKTAQSFRRAALSDGLLREIEDWRKLAPSTAAHAWVFPSERMTPMDWSEVGKGWPWLSEFPGDAPDSCEPHERSWRRGEVGCRSARSQPRRQPKCLHAVGGFKTPECRKQAGKFA
jgi:integrase